MPKQNTYVVSGPSKKSSKMVIDMNRMNLHKSYIVPTFKTGAHETKKSKPRDKNWRKWDD